MEHYRAIKWGVGATLLSPFVLFGIGLIHFTGGGNPFVTLLSVLLLEAYAGFIFYCILCVPVARRILLLVSIVLIAATAALLFGGPRDAASVLVPGIILCVLGGLPRWVGLGVMIFIVNTFILLTSSMIAEMSALFGGRSSGYYIELQVAYVFLAYIGLGIALLPHLDWRTYLSGWNRRGGKLEQS